MEWLDFREPVNAWTHGVWLLLALPAGLILWHGGRGDRVKQASLLVFSLSLAICFAGSTLFHAVRLPAEQVEVFAALDRVGIYLFIAGTVTPVAVVLLPGRWRLSLLATVWLAAGGGIVLCATSVSLPRSVTTGIFLGMGWGCAACYFVVARLLSHRAMRPMVIGGLCYSTGAICNLLHWPVLIPGVFAAHELFHVFVMAGSLAHFWFMLRVVAPYARPLPIPASDDAPAAALAPLPASAG
jgi:hemolysin III